MFSGIQNLQYTPTDLEASPFYVHSNYFNFANSIEGAMVDEAAIDTMLTQLYQRQLKKEQQILFALGLKNIVGLSDMLTRPDFDFNTVLNEINNSISSMNKNPQKVQPIFDKLSKVQEMSQMYLSTGLNAGNAAILGQEIKSLKSLVGEDDVSKNIVVIVKNKVVKEVGTFFAKAQTWVEQSVFNLMDKMLGARFTSVPTPKPIKPSLQYSIPAPSFNVRDTSIPTLQGTAQEWFSNPELDPLFVAGLVYLIVNAANFATAGDKYNRKIQSSSVLDYIEKQVQNAAMIWFMSEIDHRTDFPSFFVNDGIVTKMSDVFLSMRGGLYKSMQLKDIASLPSSNMSGIDLYQNKRTSYLNYIFQNRNYQDLREATVAVGSVATGIYGSYHAQGYLMI